MKKLNSYQCEKALKKGLYVYELGIEDEDGIIPIASFAFRNREAGASCIYDMLKHEYAYRYIDSVRLKKSDKRYRDLRVNEKALGIMDLESMAGIPAWEM